MSPLILPAHNKAVPATTRTDTVVPMTWRTKSLTRNSICTKCATRLAKGEKAWCTARDPNSVRCLSCGPADPGTGVDLGWYLMGVLLASELHPSIAVLPQYVVSGSSDPVGHVVIAPTGVWLINAVRLEGAIDLAPRAAQLRVGDADHAELLTPLIIATDIVRGILPDLPVSPALVLMEGEWSDADSSRLKRQGPFIIKKVAVSGPHSLIERIDAPGTLTPRIIANTKQRLAAALAR